MGILDDAIKEHLELKRQHGAAESELKQLEDEAFGAAERPGSEATPPDPLAEAPTEFMEQPEVDSSASKPQGPDVEEAASRPAPRAEIADLQEAPPSPPAEEEASATEHEVPTGPTTDEREAIAEQPTEMYDIEEEHAATQAEAVEVEAADADTAEEADEDDEDDDFWDEKRLSDELDQALEAPSETEDEEEVFSEPEPAAEVEPEEQPPAQPDEQARHDDEDVLEETPDFLEETPEDDQLWFEQKPPKDFDFDD